MQLLRADDEGDRTRQYQERAARQTFLGTLQQEDPSALFGQMGISVRVRLATKADIPRLEELINRTNQFNLCGSRTTAAELDHWLASGERQILLADASDRFGSMGIVCIAIAHCGPHAIEIPLFVLSCRVFGYGIETAMLRSIQCMAWNAIGGGERLALLGHYRQTEHNEPCRSFYPANGFQVDGIHWRLSAESVLTDPPWLTVHRDLPTPAPRRSSRPDDQNVTTRSGCGPGTPAHPCRRVDRPSLPGLAEDPSGFRVRMTQLWHVPIPHAIARSTATWHSNPWRAAISATRFIIGSGPHV